MALLVITFYFFKPRCVCMCVRACVLCVFCGFTHQCHLNRLNSGEIKPGKSRSQLDAMCACVCGMRACVCYLCVFLTFGFSCLHYYAKS